MPAPDPPRRPHQGDEVDTAQPLSTPEHTPAPATAVEVPEARTPPEGWAEAWTEDWEAAAPVAEAAARPVLGEITGEIMGEQLEHLAPAPSAAEVVREGKVDWEQMSLLLHGCLARQSRQVVLLVRCTAADDDRPLPPRLLGRLIGSVAQAYVYTQGVDHPPKGAITVVLHGWSRPRISAEWSDDEPDEFRPARLG